MFSVFMQYIQPLTKRISLNSCGITSKSIYYQLSADELQAETTLPIVKGVKMLPVLLPFARRSLQLDTE